MSIGPLRILMIAPTSFFADYGCHVRILEEIRALQTRGHQVRVCTYHNGDDLPGIDIVRTVDVPWRRRVVVGSSRHKMYLDAALLWTVTRQTLNFRPDIIHAHLHEGALIGGIVGRATGRPVVFDYQGSLTEEMLDHGFLRRGSPVHRFFWWLERRIDGLPDLIIPSSSAGRDYLVGRGVSPNRVELVADAVDVSRFDPETTRQAREEVRRRLGIPPSARVVVYLGLLADYQGTPFLLKAAAQLRARYDDLYFLVAGYPGVGRHASIARHLGIEDRVLLPGRIPYRDAPSLLAAGDVAVAPKLSMTEGNGKIINYMAMGLPVVATDTEPNRDLLGPLGIYIPPFRESALAFGIERAFKTERTIQEQLRERAVRLFSWDSRVELLENVYARVRAIRGAEHESQASTIGGQPASKDAD